MDRKTVQNILLYKEFSEDKRKEWFSFTRSKFISHVDTFYYSVKTVGDWSCLLGARTLVQTLKKLKEDAAKENEPMPFMENDVFGDLVVKPRHGFGMYRYGITKEDCFDIFVAENVPNTDTNAIHVQLRSQFLWLHGVKEAFYESLVYLYGILERYGIDLADITENRIDFAYHTNYIQDMFSFFRTDKIPQMAIHNYDRGGMEWRFKKDLLDVDYLSFGRRKSNSSFVRIYNKSKEVVEMGYKQFFVPIWRENGLISQFDKYVFDKIFDEGKNCWNYKEVARCLFYLEYGQDEEIKYSIRQLLVFEDSPVNEYKKLADSCVPDLTDVVNIEVQIKRDFTLDFIFPKIKYPKPELKEFRNDKNSWVPLAECRIYKILHMLQSIRDFITHDTLRFVKYKGAYKNVRRELRPTADWWLRLSACGELDGISYDICREYQKRYDIKRCKTRNLTNIATLSTLLEDWDTEDISFMDDVADIVSYINDNDLAKYSRIRERKRREFRSHMKKQSFSGAAPVDRAVEPDGFEEQPNLFVFDERGQMEYGNSD